MDLDQITHSSADSQRNKPVIVIIDDDLDNLLFASYIIESLGFNSVVCNDSMKAISIVSNFIPDLVLLDIVMPNLSGIDILQKIKQNKNTKNVPIIAVTGLARETDKILIVEAGFDSYIVKPYLIEDLEAKIKYFLGKKNCILS